MLNKQQAEKLNPRVTSSRTCPTPQPPTRLALAHAPSVHAMQTHVDNRLSLLALSPRNAGGPLERVAGVYRVLFFLRHAFCSRVSATVQHTANVYIVYGSLCKPLPYARGNTLRCMHAKFRPTHRKRGEPCTPSCGHLLTGRARLPREQVAHACVCMCVSPAAGPRTRGAVGKPSRMLTSSPPFSRAPRNHWRPRLARMGDAPQQC